MSGTGREMALRRGWLGQGVGVQPCCWFAELEWEWAWAWAWVSFTTSMLPGSGDQDVCEFAGFENNAAASELEATRQVRGEG